MSLAKSIYRRIIPEPLRRPIGRARRAAADRLTRIAASSPLPPPSLLMNVQMTPYVDEFIRIGRRSARSIETSLTPMLPGIAKPAVLDFGCGCGRTLLHLRSNWDVHGCDIDRDAIDWLCRTIDATHFKPNDPSPPLPWPEAAFDGAYAVSVFTHFSEDQHAEWRRELARVLRPGGILAVTSMGPGILSNFPAHASDENRSRLRETGFFFAPATTSFNANAAFHSPLGLARLLFPEFDLVATSEQGLDGFQDLSLFRRN